MYIIKSKLKILLLFIIFFCFLFWSSHAKNDKINNTNSIEDYCIINNFKEFYKWSSSTWKLFLDSLRNNKYESAIRYANYMNTSVGWFYTKYKNWIIWFENWNGDAVMRINYKTIYKWKYYECNSKCGFTISYDNINKEIINQILCPSLSWNTNDQSYKIKMSDKFTEKNLNTYIKTILSNDKIDPKIWSITRIFKKYLNKRFN